eukprot:Em0010g870a
MGRLSSESGVQQGDPLGSLLFALVLHKVISAIDTDDECLDLLYQAWYMDDGVLAGKSALDPLGHHAATCKHGGDAVLRHNKLRDILVESFHQAHICVQVEAGSGLSQDHSNSRPADILVFDRDQGKPAALDLTVVSPLNANILKEAGMTAGSAAQAAEVGLMTDGLNDHSTAVARRPSQNQLCFIKILRKNTTIMLSSVTEFGLRFFTFVTSIDRGNCSSGTCIPILNLAIQFLNISYEASNGTGQSLVAQQTTNLNLWFNISNSGQNAFAAVLTFLVLKSKLYFIRCDPNLAYLSTIQDYSPALFLCTCQVANPLPGGNYSVIAVRMAPTANIDVTQGVIPLMFNVSSQNPENQTTVQDNSVSVQMNITAASGLSVDPIGFCSYPAETPASETILGLSGVKLL